MNSSTGFVNKASLSKSFEGRKDIKDKEKKDQKSLTTQQKQQQHGRVPGRMTS